MARSPSMASVQADHFVEVRVAGDLDGVVVQVEVEGDADGREGARLAEGAVARLRGFAHGHQEADHRV